MFLAHRIVRQVIFDAATDEKIDPYRLSFLDSLRLIQCRATCPRCRIGRRQSGTSDCSPRSASRNCPLDATVNIRV